MARVTNVLRRAYKSIEDLDLLRILESELNHELSSMRFQNEKMGSFGDFVVEWDSPKSQDVILRKKCSSSGEEVAISALLGRDTFHEDSRFPAEALLKICVKKPGLSSILKFDCVASNRGGTQPDFHIHNAHYIPSSSLSSSVYRGPLFSDLDPALQHELKQYLAARGIEEDFTNNLLLYLHKKEQGQYTGWLQKLKEMMDRT
ncbi:mitochondrial acidic protein MAM33 [Salvia splendens]|uniref:mitochondrial acidic protein MAM33 n=1 Tax=Salvia splendens TaxID=180675 RepID=UPI001C267B98|nr:mitochondrial acidic protein MAM33 [Salvia splendens]XP_042001126.1 mitochondrial acidic protein MAM33 [Salvia splendens]